MRTTERSAAAATKMWAAVALRGISKNMKVAARSPEGGHVLEGTAVHCSFVGDHLDG